MRLLRLAPFCLLMSLAACMPPITSRSADIFCGDSSAQTTGDSSLLSIVLDSAANGTVQRIDLEVTGVGGVAMARMQLDSLAASCFSDTKGLRVALAGAWSKSPYIQLSTGTHFARTTVRAGRKVLLDTILDMTGPVYQAINWRSQP